MNCPVLPGKGTKVSLTEELPSSEKSKPLRAPRSSQLQPAPEAFRTVPETPEARGRGKGGVRGPVFMKHGGRAGAGEEQR